MAKSAKNRIANMLSKNLRMFFPNLRAHFMCPTCLAKFPVGDKNRISEAHIIPKAAGGKLKTLLCTKCNNRFGSNQDKWFGELIKIAKAPHSSVLSTSIKDGHFMIAGHRVNGHWSVDKKNNFTFCYDVKRNSPHINKLVQRLLESSPASLELRIPLPILREQDQVRVGFLTAGYLMFFATFGYSWVLQDHLDPIRHQIRNPEKEVIPTKYFASVNVALEEPCIGFMRISQYQVPTFCFLRSFVLYPTIHYPRLYSELADLTQNVDSSDICVVRFRDKPRYDKRLVVLMEDQAVIAPANLKENEEPPDVVQFSCGSSSARSFRPVGEEEFKRLQKNPLSRTVTIDCSGSTRQRRERS